MCKLGQIDNVNKYDIAMNLLPMNKNNAKLNAENATHKAIDQQNWYFFWFLYIFEDDCKKK